MVKGFELLSLVEENNVSSLLIDCPLQTYKFMHYMSPPHISQLL